MGGRNLCDKWLAASAGPESVMRAMALLNLRRTRLHSQCRSDTTSTIVKRRWHVLRYTKYLALTFNLVSDSAKRYDFN